MQKGEASLPKDLSRKAMQLRQWDLSVYEAITQKDRRPPRGEQRRAGFRREQGRFRREQGREINWEVGGIDLASFLALP